MAMGGDVNKDTMLATRLLGFEGSPSELEGFLSKSKCIFSYEYV